MCPVFIVVAGMWGCGLCNPPDYVVSMTRDISDGIFLALPACVLCMSLCIVWLHLEIFLCVSMLSTPEIFFPAEADLDLCMHCKSRNSTQLTRALQCTYYTSALFLSRCIMCISHCHSCFLRYVDVKSSARYFFGLISFA